MPQPRSQCSPLETLFGSCDANFWLLLNAHCKQSLDKEKKWSTDGINSRKILDLEGKKNEESVIPQILIQSKLNVN